MALEAVIAALGGEQEQPQVKPTSGGYGTPARILDNLRRTESNGDTFAVNKTSKAMGPYQFLPDTVAMLHRQGVKFNPFDEGEARNAADYYLQQLSKQHGGDMNKAVAAYGGFSAGRDASGYTSKVLSGAESSALSQPLAGAIAALSEPAPKAVEASVATRAVQPPTMPIATEKPVASNTDNFLAGFGKGITDVGRGVKQILDIPAQWLESKFPGISKWSQEKLGMPSAAESASATNAEVEESQKIDQPLRETKAGFAGEVAGNIATTMLPLGVAAKASPTAAALLNPRTYKMAMAAGALQGALQPVGATESRTANIALGAGAGAAGNLAVNTIGRIAQPVASVMSSAHEKAVRVLEAAGIPLDAAQKSGSVFLNRIRSSFFDNPWTAGPQRVLGAEQQAGFNRAVLKTIGEDTTEATSEVMKAAEKSINGVFRDVLNRNNVSVTDTTLNRIGAVQAAASESEKKPIVSMANRLIDAVNDSGEIKGQVAYGIKKDLDRLASSADSDLAYHARQLRTVLMDAVNGSLNDADRKAFATARGQFANMKRIEPAIDKMGRGDISPARLANVMGQKANRAASIYGKGPQELVDLAHAGNLLLGDKLPNSGTTARLVAQSVLPVAGGFLGAEYGDAKDAGMGAAAGVLVGGVGPRLIQKAMQNPRTANYLASGIRTTPIRDLLLLPQNSGAIGTTLGGVLRRVPPAVVNQKP